MFDALADYGYLQPTVSDHLVRKAKRLIANRNESSLEALMQYLHIGYRRAFALMNELQKQSIINVTADMKFERLVPASTEESLLKQLRPALKKYKRRDAELVIRTLFVDKDIAEQVLARIKEE